MHVLFRYGREPCVRAALLALHLGVPPTAAALALHRPTGAVRGTCRPLPRAQPVHARGTPGTRILTADARPTAFPGRRRGVPSRHAGARPRPVRGQTRVRAGSGRGQTPRTAVRALRRPARAAERRARAGRSVPELPRARSGRRRRRGGRAMRSSAPLRGSTTCASSATSRRPSWARSTGRDRARRAFRGLRGLRLVILEAFAEADPRHRPRPGGASRARVRFRRRTRLPHSGRARRSDRTAPHRPCPLRRTRRQGPGRLASPVERGTPSGGVLRRHRGGPWKPTVS